MAERDYGNPESGQTIINVTNGKVIRLLVNDEPFDVRYGELRSHERCLDFRAGVLGRQAEWVSPTGCAVKVTSTRLVSFTQRSIAAICYEVEPVITVTGCCGTLPLMAFPFDDLLAQQSVRRHR